MRHLHRRSIGLVIALGMFAGCALFTEPNPIGGVTPARARWLASPPQDYTFRIGFTCFCVGGPLQVQVVGGTVVSVKDSTGTPLTGFTMTLATLWDRILSARDRGDLVSASFDHRGVPIEAEIGELANDSGVRYSVSNYHRSR